MKSTFSLLIAFFLTAFVSAQAAVLVEYSFTGDTVTPTTTGTGITAGNFDDSNTSGGAFNAANSGPSGSPSYRMNNANEATPTDYFSFTLQPTTGTDLVTYESISLYENRFNGGLMDIRYVIGGRSEVSIASGVALTDQSGSGPDNMTFQEFDFTDFQTSQTVEFRIYGYDTGGASDAIRFDDISVTGTVIPEPTASAMVMGAMLMTVAFRRRLKA